MSTKQKPDGTRRGRLPSTEAMNPKTTDLEPRFELVATGSGWTVNADGAQLEIVRGPAGGWRVTSASGRERVDSSVARAAAAVCRIDTTTGWLRVLERRLTTHG